MALVVKNLPASAGEVGDMSLIPGLGRSPGGGHGNPLPYSCLENPMDRGAWWSNVHRVTKSRTWLKHLSVHIQSCRGKTDHTKLQRMCKRLGFNYKGNAETLGGFLSNGMQGEPWGTYCNSLSKMKSFGLFVSSRYRKTGIVLSHFFIISPSIKCIGCLLCAMNICAKFKGHHQLKDKHDFCLPEINDSVRGRKYCVWDYRRCHGNKEEHLSQRSAETHKVSLRVKVVFSWVTKTQLMCLFYCFILLYLFYFSCNTESGGRQ